MTSRDKTVSFNTQGLALGLAGGWAATAGLLAFPTKPGHMVTDAVSLFTGLAGMAMLTASLVIHEEKEEQGTDIGTMVAQLQRKENLGTSVNEPAILVGIGCALIVLGLYWGLYALRKDRFESWKWQPAVIFSIGLIMWSFASAAENNAMSSMNSLRLAWTLPGVVLVLTALYTMPYAMKHGHQMWTGPVCLTGLLLFSIGGSWITRT